MINEKTITLRQVLKEVYYSKKDNVKTDDFDKMSILQQIKLKN